VRPGTTKGMLFRLRSIAFLVDACSGHRMVAVSNAQTVCVRGA